MRKHHIVVVKYDTGSERAYLQIHTREGGRHNIDPCLVSEGYIRDVIIAILKEEHKETEKRICQEQDRQHERGKGKK